MVPTPPENALNQKCKNRAVKSASQLNNSSVVDINEEAATHVATTDGAYSWSRSNSPPLLKAFKKQRR